MKQTHGICGLSVINVYKTPSESSEVVNQLLYGDHFTLIEVKIFWSKIRFEYDESTGYILNSLYATIDSDLAKELDDFSKAVYNRHLTNYALLENQQLLPILIGSRMDIMSILGHENKETKLRKLEEYKKKLGKIISEKEVINRRGKFIELTYK